VDTQLDLENGVRDLGTTFQLECHRRPTRFGPTHGRGVAQERDNELLRREAAVMIHRIAGGTEYVDAARECKFEITLEPQVGRPENSVIRAPTKMPPDDTPAVGLHDLALRQIQLNCLVDVVAQEEAVIGGDDEER